MLVGDHLLLRGFGLNGKMFMKVCVVKTLAMEMLLRNFGPPGIIFTIICVY
jgi:hypothetical protein